MINLKVMTYTVFQYYALLLAVFLGGIALAAFVRRRNRKAGSFLLAAVFFFCAYMMTLEVSAFDFFGLVNNHVRTKEKVVALTFDDGPSEKYTPRILDELKAAGAHATFFVTGENAERHPELLRRMVLEGHEIGNHTYSHPFMFKESSAERKDQIARASAAIEEACGVKVKYFRAPYEYRDVRLVRLLHTMGLQYTSHNVSSLDAMRAGEDKIVSQVVTKAHPGTIVLMHDARGNREATVQALPVALKQLKRMGYKAVTISNLKTAAQ